MYEAPASAVLMAAAVPENVMVASVVPSPEVKVRPAMPESENVPLVTATVTVRVPVSTSATVMRLELAAEKTRAVSSVVVCAPGTVLVGASLTGEMVRLTVAVSVTPPEVTV